MTAIRIPRPFKKGSLRWAGTALLLATAAQPFAVAAKDNPSPASSVNSPPAGEQPGVDSAAAALARFGIPADRLSLSLKPDAGAAHYRVRIRGGHIEAEGTSPSRWCAVSPPRWKSWDACTSAGKAAASARWTPCRRWIPAKSPHPSRCAPT
ncbi:hypothetical protein ACFSLT_23670 [Novosphingobium resinovorum]